MTRCKTTISIPCVHPCAHAYCKNCIRS
ncbi:TPA: hypothetical protein HA338_15130 [Methanosarcina acetivorans]|uniref:Zinc finger C3HC4 RING-type domain-containing protein n=1 Tax=Methanosarcina acetivorans TaxID=2214 RepID=A0A832SEC1_9EURY|nr:hypothetical protein [Methanosarcina acetivorans]